jgi:hypothetical protein
MWLEVEGPWGRHRTGDWLEAAPRQVVANSQGGAAELAFGPLPVGGAAPPSWLRLVNLLPRQLDSLSLSDNQGQCYELVSRVDALGRTTSAGDLLLAMARMDGWNALVVDVRGLRCINAATRVLCRVVGLPLDQARHCRLQCSRF